MVGNILFLILRWLHTNQYQQFPINPARWSFIYINSSNRKLALSTSTLRHVSAASHHQCKSHYRCCHEPVLDSSLEVCLSGSWSPGRESLTPAALMSRTLCSKAPLTDDFFSVSKLLFKMTNPLKKCQQWVSHCGGFVDNCMQKHSFCLLTMWDPECCCFLLCLQQWHRAEMNERPWAKVVPGFLLSVCCLTWFLSLSLSCFLSHQSKSRVFISPLVWAFDSILT